MLRRSYTLLRGRYSSMMDLGGVAPADCKAKIDFSRNNKLKAVALDFNLLTRSIEATKEKMVLNSTQQKERQDTIYNDNNNNKTVVPDVSLVESIANLLNISLPGDSSKKNINTSKSTIESKTNETFSNTTKAPPVTDIRGKYAAKLRKKDIHSLNRDILDNDSNPIMKGQQIGDASGHFRVKNIIRNDPSISSSANTGSKWISHSGNGILLKFLTDRSMKIVLLPIPRTTDNDSTNTTKQSELSAMQNLSNQLKKDVSFHKLIQEGPDAQQALDQFFSSLHYEQKEDEGTKSLDAINNRTTVYLEKECLVVSDRDDYLRFARDQGMFTCRVRPLNAPRGNVTTNYTVEDVNEIEDIINEINGLSFGNILGSK